MECVAGSNRGRGVRAGSVVRDAEGEPAATWAAEDSKTAAPAGRLAFARYWGCWNPPPSQDVESEGAKKVSPDASSEAAAKAEEREEPPAVEPARTHAAARLKGLQAAGERPRPIVR